MNELDRISQGYGWTPKQWHREAYGVISAERGERHAALTMLGIFRYAEIREGMMYPEMYIPDEDIRERAKPYMQMIAKALGGISLYDPPIQRDQERRPTKQPNPEAIEARIKERARDMRQHLTKAPDMRSSPEVRNEKAQLTKFRKRKERMQREKTRQAIQRLKERHEHV